MPSPRKLIFLILSLYFISTPAFFAPRAFAYSHYSALNRPFLIGPHYPLIFLSTTFEPDTAFNLKEGNLFTQLSYTSLNTYVFSQSSDKYNNPSGDPSVFHPTTTNGYSIYFDGEIQRRYLRFYYGWSKNLELQFTVREIKFTGGKLDSSIEGFHDLFNIGNQGREQAPRDQLNIYIYDNQTGKMVAQVTKPSNGYLSESMTLSLKWQIMRTKRKALSLTFSSNFKDQSLATSFNEISGTFEKHKNFNDSNISLNYTALYNKGSIFAAYSVAEIKNSLLARSPNQIYYQFLGGNYHYDKTLDLLFQALVYTSPFPADGLSTSSKDIVEVTAGTRWIFNRNYAFELGVIENQSQGAQNIDVAFFANVMATF